MTRPLAYAVFGSMALWLVGCHRDPPKAQVPAVPVRVAAPGGFGGSAGAIYSASVTPYAQVDVAFKVNGYVAQIRQVRGADGRMRDVQQGDTVKRGTVLAKVRDAEYVDKVTTHTANLDKANASLEKASADFKRATDLIATQSITQPDYDSAKREYDTAQASVIGAKAQLDEAKLNLGYTNLLAPMDGVLLSRKIEVGGLVGPGSVGFVLADVRSVKVVFSVPDVMLQKVALGSTAEVTTEAIAGRTFSGKVTAVSPSADTKTRSFEIEVGIPNPRGELKDGMVATLRAPGDVAVAPTSAMAVPLSAVIRAKGDASGYAVYVVADNAGKLIARLRPVQLGPVFGDSIAVTSGIAAGDRIIVTGATVVTDGDPVSIAP